MTSKWDVVETCSNSSINFGKARIYDKTFTGSFTENIGPNTPLPTDIDDNLVLKYKVKL